ncbi:MAG: LysR family transcriptional regulator [Halobacteriovoraceae bacterium]|jgi:DNA-binding transcriptional LysR family regulator|nr:LysR family transcriptional regulator [Halobacteriovoraceae bacterium]MBT5092696.1 LysR family transcriptional regulator [Halobacteriovoraceae bacterium]
MDLKYDDLQTFLKVFEAGTFTKAAGELGLSQSALSQKVARLEDVLQATLLIRHPRSLSLTATGEKLLLHAKQAIQMQSDFLQDYNQYQSELNGVLRIAGYSSVMDSIIIPKLAPFLRKNPGVKIEFSSYEMFELPALLKSNSADFILTDSSLKLPATEELKIGEEEYVEIRAKKYPKAPNTYLDHTSKDNATASYFQFIGKKPNYQRAYMGGVYSIIEGVAEGLGHAVMSKHLVEKDKRFEMSIPKKRFVRPLILTYHTQNYYGPLQQEIQKLLSLA